jgi:hypothetical protein
MSLIEKINSALQKKAKTATEKYYAALRSGDGDAILAAAAAAGISPDRVAADGEILDKAAELRIEAEKLPKLEKASVAATQAAKAAADELERQIRPLEAKAESTAYDAGEAGKALRACRSAAGVLEGLYKDNPHLLIRDDAPAPLLEKWKTEAKADAANKPKLAAMDRFHKSMNALRAARLNHNAVSSGPWTDAANSASLAALQAAESEFADARRVAIEAGISAADLDGAVGHSLPELIRN